MTDPKMLTRADNSNDFMKGLSLGMLLVALAVVIAFVAYCAGRADGTIAAKAAAHALKAVE